jgi:hypothetical protein
MSFYEYTPDIVRVNLDNYNNTNDNKILNFAATSAKSILNDTNEYYVTIEKLEIPVNGENMIINSDETPYNLMIFNDVKVEDLIIPGLSFGPNWFNFNGPFYSVQQFLDKLNDFILKKPLPLTLGQFILNKNSNNEYVIQFQYNKLDNSSFGNLFLYIDKRLEKLLNFNMDYNDTTTNLGIKYTKVNIVTEYTTGPNEIVKINQNKLTYANFFNLKSIRVYSNLPTDGYVVYDMSNKIMNTSNLLCETIFDSLSMFDISNYIYIPTQFRHTSMYNSNSINYFELTFKLKYADGKEYDIILNPNTYASITLAFFKKNIN